MAIQSHRPSLGAVAARRATVRWRPGLRLGVVLAIAALTAELAYIACASPRFAVREVELRGDPRVIEQVSSRISLPANTNMLRAPTRRVAEQVEAVAAVRRARVSRDFPSRLVVTVEGREAIAVIRQDAGAMLVDPDGTVFALRDEWGWGLPELVGPHLIGSSARNAAAADEIASLLTVLRAFGPDPRLRMTRLTFRGDRDIEVTLYSGPKAQLGETTELGEKARLLTETVEQLGAECVEYVNLSDPRAAYWRPRADFVSAGMR